MFDHLDEAGPQLALMARMAIALGCEAGMVKPDTLCIELRYSQQLTWHIPEPHQALFAGLPPYTRPVTPVAAEQRTEALNQAFALPQDWLLRCASQLEVLGRYGSSNWRTVLATDAWREPHLRDHEPERAATWWHQDLCARSAWVARYADLTMADEAVDPPELLSASDDHAESARLQALTPQYQTFTPEQAYQAVQASNQAHAESLSEEQKQALRAEMAERQAELAADELADQLAAEEEALLAQQAQAAKGAPQA